MELVNRAILTAIFIFIVLIINIGMAVEELKKRYYWDFVSSVVAIMGIVGALVLQICIAIIYYP